MYTATLLGSYDRADRPLADEYRHAGNDRRGDSAACDREPRGLRHGQVVLAWLASGSPRLTPIVGVSSIEQVDQAMAGVTTELDASELERLNAA